MLQYFLKMRLQVSCREGSIAVLHVDLHSGDAVAVLAHEVHKLVGWVLPVHCSGSDALSQREDVVPFPEPVDLVADLHVHCSAHGEKASSEVWLCGDGNSPQKVPSSDGVVAVLATHRASATDLVHRDPHSKHVLRAHSKAFGLDMLLPGR